MQTYKFRLYPTKAQETVFESWLEECRMLYNHFLNQRKEGWEKNKESFSLYGQQSFLPELKIKFPKLKTVYSQVLQNVAVRVDLAFQDFFRRVKNGGKPGHPRFKKYGRYDSFCYPDSQDVKISENTIHFPKIGKVHWIQHRNIIGSIKTTTIKRHLGKWYAFLVTDNINKKEYPKTDKTVGIDVGVMTFATLSDGSNVENPRFFEKKQKDLAKVQRRFQKARDSKNERKIKKTKRVIQKVHEKIYNCRHDFLHKTTNSLVQKYDVIAIEDLNINSLLRKKWCNKQILDAAWGNFILTLSIKAECAGKKIVKVNPAYSSQVCHKCDTRTAHVLSERTFKCGCCGYTGGRDENASKNILRLGLQSLAAQAA